MSTNNQYSGHEDLVKAVRSIKQIEEKVSAKLDVQSKEFERMSGTSTQTAVKLQDLEDKHDSLEREIKGMIADYKKELESMQLKNNRPGFGETPTGRAPGTAFCQSPEFKSYVGHGANGLSGAVEVPMQRKDIAGDEYLRNIFAFEKVQQIFADPLRPNRIRDLFPVINTSAASVEFVLEDVFLNQPSMVPEGTQKPESSFNFIDKSYQMRTLAHYTYVNRQTLNDIGQLQAYLDLRLTEGLKEKEDTQILYGSGTNSDLQGIMNTNGIQKYSWSAGSPGDTKIDAFRRAMTHAQLAYYPVTGAGMHPTDWESIELTKATTGLYVWVNVATGNEPMLWKVPIIANSAFVPGDCILGAFRMAAAIYDREAVTMRMSDSHLGIFTQNRLVILIEERLCVVVFRPKSLVKVTFDNAPAS